MGRYGIGARVRDGDGDEGVVVDKRKGERLVEDDGSGLRVWWPKAELTAVRLRLEIGKTYIDREGTQRGPLAANTSWDAAAYPFTDGPRTWQSDGTFCHGESDGWDLVAAVEAEPSAEEGEADFAVGDRVVITNTAYIDDEAFLRNGQVGTITNATPTLLVVAMDGDEAKFGWAFFPNQIAHFRLEAGKTYRTRDGRKVGPMEEYCGGFIHVRGDGMKWDGDGSAVNDHADLVAGWVEPNPAIEAVAGEQLKAGDVVRVVRAPKFKVGDKVDLMRDGEPVERWSNMIITSMDNDSTLYPIMTDGGLQVYEDELRLSPAKPAWTPKAGDKIKWLGKFDASMLTVGATYEIKRLHDGWVDITDDRQTRGDHSWDVVDLVDKFELVTTPPLLIGQAVVASGYISGANGNNFSVVFGDKSYDLPATSLKKAA